MQNANWTNSVIHISLQKFYHWNEFITLYGLSNGNVYWVFTCIGSLRMGVMCVIKLPGWLIQSVGRERFIALNTAVALTWYLCVARAAASTVCSAIQYYIKLSCISQHCLFQCRIYRRTLLYTCTFHLALRTTIISLHTFVLVREKV